MTTAASQQTGDYTADLTLPVPPAAVAELLTSPEGVSRWWGPTTGNAGPGGTLVVSFGEHGVNAVRVREVGADRVVWEPVAAPGTTPTGHTAEWLGTAIEFDVAADGEGTRLRFRHTGLTPQLTCWEACAAGWNYFLASIQTYAETGRGTPFGT